MKFLNGQKFLNYKENIMLLKPGITVKYTISAALPKRDAWQRAGSYPLKSNLKKDYEQYVQKRGVIQETLEKGYKILWNDGTISNTIDYLVEQA